jgi:excisionase family DNA binding protein
MTQPGTENCADRLLTVEAAAERMSTSVRFVRRLIAERRIAFVKLGRHVRLTEADVTAFIESGRVTPLDSSHIWHTNRRVS